MAIITKRTIMSLYSDNNDIYSHQVRIVLAEKGVNVEMIPVIASQLPPDLIAVNPYGSVPTLIDRDLVLFEARIIMEYLDERFPHPPLLPVYPVARAESRKMMFRIERDWYSLFHQIMQHNLSKNAPDSESVNNSDNYNDSGKAIIEAQNLLKDSIIGLAPIFADKPYFLSDEFSLLDCALAPLFWRLPLLGIEIPEDAESIHQYMQRIFTREAFQVSLSESERNLRIA